MKKTGYEHSYTLDVKLWGYVRDKFNVDVICGLLKVTWYSQEWSDDDDDDDDDDYDGSSNDNKIRSCIF